MSTVACRAMRCHEDPQVLRQVARSYADRKTVRFLADEVLSAFVTAVCLAATVDDVERHALGLFTAGSHEPDSMAEVPFAAGTSVAEQVAALAKHCRETVNPSEWLSHMPNTVVCHAAMATGLQGPHAHHVGGRDAIWGALHLAIGALDAGVARAVVVLAFDPTGRDGNPYATGVVMRPGNDPAAEGSAVLNLPALEELPDDPASAVFDSLLDALGVEVEVTGEAATTATAATTAATAGGSTHG